MNRTEPKLIAMRCIGDCKFCGRMLASAGTDLFHGAPVCDEFLKEIALLGGQDFGPATLSVDTKTAN